MDNRRLRALLVTGVLLALLAVTLSACGAGGQEANKKSESGGSAATNGQIVFRRYFNADQTKGALFTMNPDGSHVRQITYPPTGWYDNVPAWSPDGERITFERWKSDQSTSRIKVVNPDTGDARTVVPCTGERCVSAIDPYFSPDSHSIAYSRSVNGPPYSAIFIVGIDGSDPHQATTTPERHKGQLSTETTDPVFSPNGKTLTFIRTNYQKENDPNAVFVQPIGSPQDAHRITPWKLNSQDRPTFSPDGKLVLFRSEPKGEEGPSNLYWVHPDGTGLHALTHAPADKRYLGSSFAPSFHKGEGWVTVGRTGGYGKEGNADVFRILIEDGKVVREVNLTKSAIWDSAPVWGTHPPVG